MVHEFARQDAMIAISNLNTYNFIFLMLGAAAALAAEALSDAVVKAVPATSGVLIQFPLYGAIAAILTQAKNGAGRHGLRPDRPCLRQPDDAASRIRW